MSLSPKVPKSLSTGVVAGADELHELLQKEKEQGVEPDSEHAVDAYLKANVADTPEKVITEVRCRHTACNLHIPITPRLFACGSMFLCDHSHCLLRKNHRNQQHCYTGILCIAVTSYPVTSMSVGQQVQLHRW